MSSFKHNTRERLDVLLRRLQWERDDLAARGKTGSEVDKRHEITYNKLLARKQQLASMEDEEDEIKAARRHVAAVCKNKHRTVEDGTVVPKVEVAKVEVPNIEFAEVDIPELEFPKLEFRKVEAPTVEFRKVAVPTVQFAKAEAPKVEDAKAELQVVHEVQGQENSTFALAGLTITNAKDKSSPKGAGVVGNFETAADANAGDLDDFEVITNTDVSDDDFEVINDVDGSDRNGSAKRGLFGLFGH